MKNVRFRFPVIFMAFAASFLLSSCEKDDDKPENTQIPDHSQELITEVQILFTEVDNPDNVFSAVWSDADGPGGNDPEIDPINLQPNKMYNVAIGILDASNPDAVEELTEEIYEEGTEHQFFFVKSSDLVDKLNIEYEDEDMHGQPIGLFSSWNATGTTIGAEIITIILRHEPNKALTSVQEGDIESAGGETDVQVDFEISIE